MLVTTPARLAKYFPREAQAWEVLTYLRLRYIAGDQAVAERAADAVQQGIVSTTSRPQFDAELTEMRRRLEESDSTPNLKTGAGGAYDIDYLAGRLQAKHRVWSHGNLSERVRLVASHGLLVEDYARELVESAEFLRALEHYVRLVTGRAGKWLPVQEHAAQCVTKFMAGQMPRKSGSNLADTATQLVGRTREIYRKYPF